MKRKKATSEELERLRQVRGMPCIACQLYGVAHQPFPTQAHHLNLGGNAGQKRRGHFHSIPLCEYHHIGQILPNVDSKTMSALYGPSLAKQSKEFRYVFGSDDELLALTNEKLEAA